MTVDINKLKFEQGSTSSNTPRAAMSIHKYMGKLGSEQLALLQSDAAIWQMQCDA